MKNIISIVFLLVLSGCSMTLPVEGNFDLKNDRFMGEATGYLSGKGRMTVQSLSGVQCDGEFQYGKSKVSGNGTFNCADGRTGTYIFTSSGYNGNGVGKLSDGESFSFRFGSPAYIQQREVQIRPQ